MSYFVIFTVAKYHSHVEFDGKLYGKSDLVATHVLQSIFLFDF